MPNNGRHNGGDTLAQKETGRNGFHRATHQTNNVKADSITSPTVPTPGTQEARLLAELQAGRSIDPLSAWLHLGIYRLADCAFNLRRKGWPVLTERFAVINRFGEACHVARYSLAEGGGDA